MNRGLSFGAEKRRATFSIYKKIVALSKNEIISKKRLKITGVS
jgi:hypothetical protein